MPVSDPLIAIDLSSRQGTLALKLRGEIWAESLPEGRHSETLIGTLERLLNQHKVPLSDISAWVLPAGPGSFTGLRIALASVKAMVLANPRPIYVVDGSEARALGLEFRAGEKISVLTELTARRWLEAPFEATSNEQLLALGPARSLPEGWEPMAGIRWICDEGIARALKQTTIETILLASSARGLLQNFLRCTSLRKIENEREVFELTPDYAGTSRFAE